MKPTNAPSSVRRRNVSVERPFFPTPSQRTVWPSACSRRSTAKARRITCALNAPARPRSPVSGTISVDAVSSRCWSSGSRWTEPAARPTPEMSSRIVSA